MNKKALGVLLFLIGISLLAFGFWQLYSRSITIKSITLTSPYNSALLEDVKIELDKPASVSVRYWESGTGRQFETPVSVKALSHTIHLVLLKPDMNYEYKVIIKKGINISSKTFSFKTRKQSPWMVHNWIKNEKPHDAEALGDGLVMLCFAGRPGYIAFVDGKGMIRWYWQVDDIGVRVATLTPRGTILALLHPSQRDEINDISDRNKLNELNKMNYPIRRGRIGYAGGTALAEIDLTGKMLWRLNLSEVPGLSDSIIHHDLRMDKDNHILTFMRDPKPYDLSSMGGAVKDTVWGDVLVKMDTTGKILWKWSPWDEWDFKKDTKLGDLSYDRFHLNALFIDKKGNYLISSAIENQIWKVNAQTGRLAWKLGKGGNVKMNPADYFYFQHDVNETPSGDIMIFDNGDSSPFDTTSKTILYYSAPDTASMDKTSRVLSFHLDTTTMTAKTTTNIALPPSKFSSRMGSAYVLPNQNILVTSSKTGTVMVMSAEGKILWELDSYFIPYRAEYIPESTWKQFFIQK